MSSRTRQKMAGFLIAIVTILSAPRENLAAAPDMLGKLNLSTYPSATKAPPFSGRTTTDQVVSLAGLQGRVVLLNFWATWCQECRTEMPMFQRLHREFASQGLSVIGINAREEIPAIQKYAKERGLNFPLVLDAKGEINAAYGVIGLPATFLIGRDGRAVARAVGPREWSGEQALAIIRALLAEPATRKKER